MARAIPVARKAPPAPYLSVCVLDCEWEGRKVHTCDLVVGGTTLTTPIPPTNEDHITLALPNREHTVAFRFRDARGQELCFFHASSRSYPPLGKVVETWVPVSAQGQEVPLDAASGARPGQRARVLVKYVNAEAAGAESLVERTFHAQDFLILALQNLGKELDQGVATTATKRAPPRAPAGKQVAKPRKVETSVTAQIELKSKRLTMTEQRLQAAQKEQQKKRAELEELAWQKSEPYRNIILVLEEKLKSFRDVDEALRLAKEHWAQSETAREELQQKLHDANEDFSRQIKESLRLHNELNLAKHGVEERLGVTEQELLTQNQAVAQAGQRIHELEQANSDLRRKLTAQASLEAELAETKASLQAEASARADLEAKVTAMQEVFEERVREETLLPTRLLDEKQDLVAQVLSAMEQIEAQKEQCAALTLEREGHCARLAQLEQEVASFDMQRRQLADATQNVARLEGQIAIRSEQFEEFKKSFERQLAHESEIQQRLLKEKGAVQEQLRSLERDSGSKQEQLRQGQKLQRQLEAQVEALQQRLIVQAEEHELHALAKGQDPQVLQSSRDLAAELRRQQAEFADQLRHLEELRADEVEQSRVYQQQLRDKTAEAEALHRRYAEERAEREREREQVVALQQQQGNDSDLARQLEGIRRECAEHAQARAELTQSLRSLSEKYEEQLREWEETRAHRDDELELRNFEISRLMARIQELATVYSAQKGDPVDSLLAHYVNTYHPQVPFLRLSPGVYLFGSRKVLMKVHGKDKLVIRVGGGFHTFEEFLELYMEEEVTKLRQEGEPLPEHSRISQSPSVRSTASPFVGGDKWAA